ncbi:MAG: Membrane protein [candidate division WS6 bacterium GW2011_GWA2_37_6]|uniref:Membrane protein n=1 Tax=candidate division WS6 bacterium GW2011_GWA2_37_6 TaxID=1619087 RepID=A0A0G0K154_9BACT|nr:MAG: Membrane protein [candidate division WS6 bacterium GW2011_GWA2_37_6]
MLTTKNLREVFFLVTIVVLFLGFIYVLSPFLGVIFIALILVELFHPWYRFLLAKLKSQKLATTLAGLSVIFTVVVPIIFVFVIVFFQASALLEKVTEFWQSHDLVNEYKNVLADVNNLIAKFSSNPDNLITNEEVKNFSINTSKDFLTVIVDALSSSVTGVFGVVTQVTLLVISIFTFFPMREKIYDKIKNVSPLEDRLDDIFINKFAHTAKSVVEGTFFVAVIMGVTSSILLWILGVEASVFWGLLITVFSIIPIGSGIVWIPISVYLIATGNITEGVILFLFGLIMTSGVDTMLRSKVTKKDGSVHPLLLAFSIIGGLQAFGALGLVYGPLIVVLFTSMMEVYKEKYRD